MAYQPCLLLVALIALLNGVNARYVVQHNRVPELSLVKDTTHVTLAFMRSEVFNEDDPLEWPLFTSVDAVRSEFAPGTAVMVAIGGWGDTQGFSVAAATEASRKRFAANVKAMVDATGADGVEIDWEYPGGNGEDYKQVPNSAKAWEVDASPKLLAEIRSALGPDKLISAAVPGLRRDMIAFTPGTAPQIDQSLDFWNIMTYDLMNRRDNVTKHHAGVVEALDAIDAYLERGVPADKGNLGFPFYVKWFRTDPKSNCDGHPVGCKTVLLEDPVTGADLRQAGASCWADGVPPELATSYARAMKYGKYDLERGGHYYWVADGGIFWSWDTPDSSARKFAIMNMRKLGGVFAWGLGGSKTTFAKREKMNFELVDMPCIQRFTSQRTSDANPFAPLYMHNMHDRELDGQTFHPSHIALSTWQMLQTAA
ncbi:glycoside hydrolase family 18 protein, partial [Aureobasidium melanogenum]